MRCCSAQREDDAVLANEMNNNEGAVAVSGRVQVPVVVGQSSEVEGSLELLSGDAVQGLDGVCIPLEVRVRKRTRSVGTQFPE